MNLRRIAGATALLSLIALPAGGGWVSAGAIPPTAPPVDTRASKPKELPPDKTAELCQAAGEELAKRGLNAEAVAQYERARQLDPRRGAILARRLAVLYDVTGDDARALVEFQRAIKTAPHDADLLNDCGYFYYERADYEQAEKLFRRALTADPNNQRAAVNLGLALGKQGQIQASLEAFRRVLPDAQAYCNVGVLLAQQGKIGEARKALEEALRLEPNLKQARSLLNHLSDAASAPPATVLSGPSN